jgi:O-Antigen ligase
MSVRQSRPATAGEAMPRAIAGALVLFLLGWVTFGFSLLDIGKYSIPLLYVAAAPFCIRITSRSVMFLALPILSTVFSIVVAALDGFNRMSILSQGVLQLLAIGVAAGVASIDWRRWMMGFTKIMVSVATPVVVYGGYQMIARAIRLPFAFLPVTNQQAYAYAGMQRGWEKEHITRASSLFVEPSEFGYFCLWLLVLGLSTAKGGWRNLALGLALGGILFSQSLAAVLGAGILLLVYFFTNPINVKLIGQIVVLLLGLGVVIGMLQPLMPEAFSHFSDRIEQALSLDERADSGRVDHLPACWAIFKEAPVWGHGLSTIVAADADTGSDVTTVTYALVLMERGAVGAAFFFAPWLMIGMRAYRLPRTDAVRTPALLLIALQLYSFFTFSLAYFPPFWLSLGITASLIFRTDLLPKRFAMGSRVELGTRSVPHIA